MQNTANLITRSLSRPLLAVLVVLVAGLEAPRSAQAQTVRAAEVDKLSQFPLDRWKKLRETERYQLKIAEKYYRDRQPNYKTAAGEYEKYLTLYERSEAAAYAQLMWSNCQVRLKKQNTAIKDGYQSVIDYWPESPEAVIAHYLIGRTRKATGEVRLARKALADVVKKHPKHLVAVFALTDLVDIANIEKDEEACIEAWKQMTFNLPRDAGKGARNSVRNRLCRQATVNLAAHYFSTVAFSEALKALATSYSEEELPAAVYNYCYSAVNTLTGDKKTKTQGEKLADLAIAYIRGRIPADRSDPMKKQAALNLWYYIADLHSYAKRDDKVLETYNQILKIFGQDDGILGRLAGWYKTRNRYDDARATYAKFKDKVEGKNQVAYSYRQQGKYLLAANAYREALNLDPENPLTWKPQIAHAYRDGKKVEEAVAVYNELITDDKKDPQQWRMWIAYTYHHSGRYKEAIAVYRQCESKFPANYWGMAECHRALKQYQQAISLYNLIAAGSKDNAPLALWRKSETYKQWKKKELEIQTLRTICKRFPKNNYAASAHARLQRDYNINVTLGGGKDE